MQINNTQNLYNVNAAAKNTDAAVPKTKTANNDKNTEQNSTVSDSSSSFKIMSLDEIKFYLDQHGIEDDTGSRADALLDIQKFANKIDSNTYDKMTDSLLSEKKSSWASMRYATFPSSEMLDENPRMFHAVLQTTLDMEDTAHSLIFSLDLKQGLEEFAKLHKDEPATLDMETDFSTMNFLGYLMNQLEQLKEDAEDGIQLSEQRHFEDFKMLFANYNNYEEMTSPTETNILV